MTSTESFGVKKQFTAPSRYGRLVLREDVTLVAWADSEVFCILALGTVENGVTLTPDRTLPEARLVEWSRPR